MPYQEYNIKIRIVNGKIGTLIDQNFPETVENIHTLIGILENIKLQQVEKLKNEKGVYKKDERDV